METDKIIAFARAYFDNETSVLACVGAITAALAEAERSGPTEADQRWRDTRTVVPCDGDDVIGYWLPASNFGKRHVGHVHYFSKRWNAVGEETHWCGTPDFWMPMPPLPSPSAPDQP